jgi:hypothetical protein
MSLSARAFPRHQAVGAAVQEIPGIRDFYAADRPPCGRLRRRLDHRRPAVPPLRGPLLRTGRLPTPTEFEEMAESWRPFRSWAIVLLRQAGYRKGITHR